MRTVVLALVPLALLGAPAVAADAVPGPGDDAVVTVGGGLRWAPDWDGAKSYTLSPMPIVGFRFLRSPFTGEPTSDTGFGLRPTFRYLSEREFDAKSPLHGLDKVDAAYEVGIAADYTDTWFRASVEVRQGFGGHSGQIVDLGLDGIFHPLPQLSLSAGPRVSFASADYMRSYYGVTEAQAAAVGVSAYRPDGGYRGAGLAANAQYDIDAHWLVKADAGWMRLSNTITDSPIMKAEGDRDQFTIGIGVAYRFGVGWH